MYNDYYGYEDEYNIIYAAVVLLQAHVAEKRDAMTYRWV